MKKIILLLIFPLLYGLMLGQQPEEAKKFIREGIVSHDKGDFEHAIKMYDKALQLDKDNAYALAEKAMTLISLHNYEESIENCKRYLQLHKGQEASKNVYVSYGTAYDGLKKPEQSIEIYDEGITLFPNFYELHFNKGITLSGMQKFDEAISCFQKSATLNPKHPGSHNAIGRLLFSTEKRIPAILAFSRFLILEPLTNRAKENLDLLTSMMKANVEKTSGGSVNVTINPAMLADTTVDGKAKENSFATTDLLLSMATALDYDKLFKKQTPVEQFIRKFEIICASLADERDKNHGFYWDYYAGYFIEMKENKFIETFANIAFASSENKEVGEWLETHQKGLSSFYAWSNAYTWNP